MYYAYCQQHCRYGEIECLINVHHIFCELQTRQVLLELGIKSHAASNIRIWWRSPLHFFLLPLIPTLLVFIITHDSTSSSLSEVCMRHFGLFLVFKILWLAGSSQGMFQRDLTRLFGYFARFKRYFHGFFWFLIGKAIIWKVLDTWSVCFLVVTWWINGHKVGDWSPHNAVEAVDL